MRIIVSLLFIFAAWRWSNWRNWRNYYPTLLFMMILSLFESNITANHKLWIMVNSPFATSSLANGLIVTFTTFPATMLLFLSNYPQKRSHRVCYILIWVLFYSMLEYVMGRLGFYSYENGWTLGWSVMFNSLMFPILRLHHQKPLLGWLFSAIIFIFIWFYFDFSLEMLKDKQ